MSLVTSAVSTVWFQRTVTIATGVTTVVDFAPQSVTNSLDYYVTISQGGGNNIRSFNMKVQRSTSTTTRDNVYGKLGSGINYEVSSAIASGNIEVSVTNNEASDIKVSIARLKLF